MDLVARALDHLPAWVQQKMSNVAVTVEAWPTQQQYRRAGVRAGRMLLGLYDGTPQSRRGQGYNLVLPDRITLFQGPLELYAGSEEQLVQAIRSTVLHEIAHHFGFSEADIRRANS